ncbi:MAG: polyprenyl diphosphate synthase [Alphaproteobacteria bacterium]|nr:polyprenyl diphosphate synthase [Alphaproteobacteria bacterium]
MQLKIPEHLAVIADGNGRWAQARGKSRMYGHTMAAIALARLLRACRKHGVKTLTGWFFSTENWNRPGDEVAHLFKMFERFPNTQKKNFIKHRIRFRLLGDRSSFSPKLKAAIADVEEATKRFTQFQFNAAINYGGRPEMVQAIQNIIKAGLNPEDITQDSIKDFLYTAGLPDPDLIVRTSGEQRLSGFMPYQGTYSEFYFPKFHFPDFTEARLLECLNEYTKRDRRFGAIKDK